MKWTFFLKTSVAIIVTSWWNVLGFLSKHVMGKYSFQMIHSKFSFPEGHVQLYFGHNGLWKFYRSVSEKIHSLTFADSPTFQHILPLKILLLQKPVSAFHVYSVLNLLVNCASIYLHACFYPDLPKVCVSLLKKCYIFSNVSIQKNFKPT